MSEPIDLTKYLQRAHETLSVPEKTRIRFRADVQRGWQYVTVDSSELESKLFAQLQEVKCLTGSK